MPLPKRIAAQVAFGIAAVCVTPTVAFGEQSMASTGEQTIFLRAYVPLYCEVEFSPAQMLPTNGIVALGQSTELCNSPRGYRIILQTPVGLSNAAVIRDGTRIPLSDSGETVLVDSDHPNLQVRQLSLELGNQTDQVTRLGLRIEVNN